MKYLAYSLKKIAFDLPLLNIYLIPSNSHFFFDLQALTHEISGTLTNHFGIMKPNSITLNILNSF